MSVWYELLLEGKLFPAINGIMESKMGYLWYVMIVLAPLVMVYIKTESMAYTATLLFWSIGFFGQALFPDAITTPLFSVFILLGLGILVFKMFSPVK